jgi:Na+-transporting methylmalonyl-CoA/oxaloacetate decarboxylase gamma subunit
MAILIYLIAMVSSLCRKIVSLEKEKTEKQVVETQDENPEL